MPSDSSRRWDKERNLRKPPTGRSQARDVECIDPLNGTGVYDKESVSQEPCEVESLKHGFAAERRKQFLRLG
jgi:hypothetical protein